MTKPTIHVNGTAADMLLDGYHRAAHAVAGALMTLQDAAPNARDYYTQGPDAWRAAQREHAARVERLVAVRDDLIELAEHVQDAIDERDERAARRA